MPYSYTTGTNADENFYKIEGVGDMPVDPRSWPLNANIITYLHQLFLISKNPLIYPGGYTIGGTWTAGEEAITRVTFGNTNLSFSHTAQPGEGARQIAENLRNQMAANQTFAATPIFVMAVGEYSGGSSWHICPPYSTWIANPRISLSVGGHSVNGTITVNRQPENILDTPACTLRLAHTVPGRAAQTNDLVGEIAFEGQTDKIENPTDENIRQIYARLQVYVADPRNGGPGGRWQFQRASSNENNVTNMLMLGQGMWLCDAQGNNPSGDPGAGNINLPSGGGIYRNGVKIL